MSRAPSSRQQAGNDPAANSSPSIAARLHLISKMALVFMALVLGTTGLKAQLPPPMFMETVSYTNLLQKYPNQSGLSNNVELIKKYLSSKPGFSMRLSTTTETAASRAETAREIKQFGRIIFTNLHSHINFSSNQFLVEQLDCPPDSYSLQTWQPINNRAKVRSDELIDGKFYVMRPGGRLSSMEFGDLDAFKKACIDASSQPVTISSTHNDVLERATIDFRQYLRFQNLGHEGVVFNSYVFDGNNFTCLGIRGDHMAGTIYTNAAGLVDKITYGTSEHYGARIFLLFYEKKFANCIWYPTRIIDVSPKGDGLYSLRAIHTIYNAYGENSGVPLPLPATTPQLYGTNVSRMFFFSNGMDYEIQGTQVVARPALVKSFSKQIPPPVKGTFAVILVATSTASLVALIMFSSKSRKK